MQGKFKAVMFDLDGTLLNTIQGIALAMNTVLEKHGFPTYNIDAYKKFVGNGVETLVLRTCPKDIDKKLYEKCLSEMKREYKNSWKDNTKPYNGIPEMLEALHSKSVYLSILTNKPHEITIDNVKALLPYNIFSDIQGAAPEYPVKPDPFLAKKIINRSNISKDFWLYVGDSDVDMQTAKAVGLYAIGVSWGFRDRKELEENGADTIIDSPEELLQYF